MEPDDDISALLPKPPPPRPDRRDAAIGAAMRRFDGMEEPRSASGRPPEEKKAWLGAPWGRPQLGAVLATGIVALVALPIWMSSGGRPDLTRSEAGRADVAPASLGRSAAPSVSSPPAPLPPASPRAIPAEPAREDGLVPAPLAQAESPDLASGAARDEAPAKSVGAIASNAEQDARLVPAPRQVPAPSPPPPPVIAPQEPALARAAPAAPPPAPVAAGRAREREEDLGDVIVTARRVDSSSRWEERTPSPPRARRSSRRGDWNACTVNDPEHRTEACTGQANPAASPLLAEGLSRAWRGDLDGAIAEFDAALAASPQSDLIYLNRGLAYDRKGDRDRALADLDRAVRLAPNSARAYYNRSLLLFREGKKDRAEADAARAVELDPRYAAVIR